MNQNQKLSRPTVRAILFLCCSTPLLLAVSCTGPRPFKGGKALTAPTTAGLTQTLVQSDNPSHPSRQTQDTIRVRTYAQPSDPSRRSEAKADRRADFSPQRASSAAPLPLAHPQPSSAVSTPSLQYSTTPILLSEREESHATTELGAAQKDTAREIGAKLSSLKSIVWVGLALFLFGLASLFWPPLKAIIASTTTSAAMAAGGLALMVLPTLIVGHELLIMGGVAAFVAAWFLAHRHGHLRGQLAGAQTSVRSGARRPRRADFSPQRSTKTP